ncbi:hypothetical protein Tco_0506106 [Tanacetum coccineum]
MSDSKHSTVTYTSVSFPVEDDSDIGSPGVDGPPIMPEDPYAYIMAAYVVPPWPDYIPGLEVPPLPDYIPGPEVPPLPNYIPGPEEELEEDNEDPEEDPADYPADRDDDSTLTCNGENLGNNNSDHNLDNIHFKTHGVLK